MSDEAADTPNLCFDLPAEWTALIDLLRDANARVCELHHFIGHHPDIARLHLALGVKQRVMVHDYALFCPRIALVTGTRRYCGEPDLTGCETCIADHGGDLGEAITPTALVRRSTLWLRAAAEIIAPSHDTARRMMRHFPFARMSIEPHTPDPPPPSDIFRPAPDGRLRIAVVGAIGIEKGYDVLLACAREAARRDLPIEFVVIGYTIDDRRLLDTGRVRITGPFKADDAISTIAAQRCAIGWLPSIWPETWSYTLGEMIKAGLDIIAFDIGAQTERLLHRPASKLLPLQSSPEFVCANFMRA